VIRTRRAARRHRLARDGRIAALRSAWRDRDLPDLLRLLLPW
jgi:hypothetical protein